MEFADETSTPLCGQGQTPCLGVPGNPNGLGDNYTNLFNYYGNPASVSPCISTKPETAPNITNTGCCVPPSDTNNANGKRGACANTLNIGADELKSGQLPCNLVALHKTWGVVPGKWEHGGVVSQNVFIEPNVEVKYKNQTQRQNVIRLRITGDNADKNDPSLPSGIYQHMNHPRGCTQKYCYSNNSPTEPCYNIACQTVYELTSENMKSGANFSTYDNPKARVGGVIATANQFGPGNYKALVRIPKTEWTDTDGRGYVFAMWTFSYAEIYAMTGDSDNFPSNLVAYNSNPKPNYLGITPPALPNLPIGSEDFYKVINHEIDIEIPSNSPQENWQTGLGWDTMNCNTWLTDIDVYEGKKPYYTQAMQSSKNLKSKPKSFVSEDGEFHMYEIDWKVNPQNPSENTVTWLFDGEVVYSTTRFVPYYAGRLVLGPWPGWWGSGRQSPQFNVAYVDVASITITPQTDPEPVYYSIGQTYDQFIPDSKKEIACGFRKFDTCSGDTSCPAPDIETATWRCDKNAGCTVCTSGDCTSDTKQYPTKAECESQSTECKAPSPDKKYACIDNSCQECNDTNCPEGTKTYSNLEDCKCETPPPPSTQTYACVNGDCVSVKTYTDDACQNKCKSPETSNKWLWAGIGAGIALGVFLLAFFFWKLYNKKTKNTNLIP